MLRIVFGLRHGCAFGRLSEKHPHVRFAEWCNGRIDVAEAVVDDARALPPFTRDLQAMADCHGLQVSPQGLHMRVQMKCTWGARVRHLLEDHGMLLLPPVTYASGTERYRIIACDGARVDALFAELSKIGTLEVESTQQLNTPLWLSAMAFPLDGIVHALTSKQRRALVAAAHAGYYRSPRSVATAEVARRLGIPRTTFEEQLRKAENRLVEACVPHLELLGSAASETTPGEEKGGKGLAGA